MPRGGVIYASPRFATMFSSRACPWRCTYCHNSYGKAFRDRSAEHVLAEIDYLVRNHGVEELVFMDDIFNFKPARAKAIAEGLIVRRIVDFIAAQGVMVHGAFMLGFPSETEDEMRATIDWAATSSFHTAAFFRVIPFKGTELFRQVEQAGHALPTDWSAYEPYQTEINLSQVPERDILRLRKLAYRRFYMKPRRLWRIFKLIPNKLTMIPYLSLLFAQRAYAR